MVPSFLLIAITQNKNDIICMSINFYCCSRFEIFIHSKLMCPKILLYATIHLRPSFVVQKKKIFIFLFYSLFVYKFWKEENNNNNKKFAVSFSLFKLCFCCCNYCCSLLKIIAIFGSLFFLFISPFYIL